MAENVNESGDAISFKTGFTSTDKMRLTSLTHEIIEELKTRRELAADNEKKIQKLLNDRFTMGWRLNQESSKLANLNEKHETERREIVRQMEEKIKDYQIEVRQHQVYRTTAEAEKETLKEEIRKLQLKSYTLEKKLVDCERQDKVHVCEREDHIKQVSTFQTQHKHLDTLVSELKSKQEQLDREMNVIQELNKRLQYQNGHQQCILDLKTGELDKLKQELLDTKIKIKVEPEKVKLKEEEMSREITLLETQTDQLTEENHTLNKDCESWKQKYWEGLKSLDESHRLLNVHLHNAAQFRDDYLSEVDKKKQLEEKLDVAEADLNEMREEIEKLNVKNKLDEEGWASEKMKLANEISDVNKQFEELKEENKVTEKSLDDSNTLVKDLEEQLSNLQEVFNIEKFDLECQTELHMLDMVHCGTQVSPETQCRELQAQVSMETKVTQTIDPSFCSAEVQTDMDNTKLHYDVISEVAIETLQKSVQTECVTMSDLENLERKSGKVDVSKDDDFSETLDEDVQQQPEDKGCDKDGSNVDNEIVGGFNTGALTDAVEHTRNVLKDEIIIISDSEDEFKLNKGKEAGIEEKTKDERDDGTDLKYLGPEILEKLYTVDTQSKGLSFYHIDQGAINPSNTDMTVTEKEENPLNTVENAIEAKSMGLKIPRFDVKVGGVAVDPEEFGVALSQDKTKDFNNNGPMVYTSRDDNNNEGADSDSYSEDIEAKNPDNTKKTLEVVSDVHKNTGVDDESQREVKPKSRKHKLTKDNTAEHFSNFNMTKSMFEVTKQRHEENEFHAKQPKLNKMKFSTNSRSNRTVKQFSSMFQKPFNDGHCSQMEQKDNKISSVSSAVLNVRKKNLSTKHSHRQHHTLYHETLMVPDEVLASLPPKTAEMVENIQETVSDKPKSNKQVTMATESALGNDSASTMELNICDRFLDRPSLLPHQPVTSLTTSLSSDSSIISPISGTSAMSLNSAPSSGQTKSYLNQIMTDTKTNGQNSASLLTTAEDFPDMEYPRQQTAYHKPTSSDNSSAEMDFQNAAIDNFTDGKLTDCGEVPGLQNESMEDDTSLNSHVELVQTNSSSKTADFIVDKSSSRGTSDFLQKYRDFVAKLKPSKSTVTKVATVGHSRTSLNTKGLSPNDGLDLKDCSKEITVKSPPREVTHAGILKDVGSTKRMPRKVTWNEYVAHKEYAVSSASDQSSQDTI